MIQSNELLKTQKEFLINKKNNPELEYQDLVDIRAQYGVIESRDCVRKGAKLLNEYLEAGWNLNCPENKIDETLYKPTSGMNADGSIFSDKIIEICDGETLTPEVLLEAHNMDSTKWKVVSYRNNFWHSQVKGGKRLVMYQSRLTVKPYQDDEISPYFVRDFLQQYEYKPLPHTKHSNDHGTGDNALVFPVADLHYNLLASKFITGNEYNCKIAQEKFLAVVDDVIERIQNKKVSKIIFPIGNDLFNANGINGETFKGTPQDNEKDIREAYIELFNLMVNIIKQLNIIAPVDIIYIPSNHDKEVTFYMLHSLYIAFMNEETVAVEFSPRTNKYCRFGKTLMMFTHDAKINKVSNIVMDEAKDLYVGAEYIEVFLAHLHSESVMTDRNITVRRLPTFSAKSIWSTEKNYGANSLSQSFIINENKNITDIIYTMI